jgi:signal transduction histidine kinase
MARDRSADPARPPLVGRFTVTRWFTLAAAALGAVTAVSIVLGGIAITRLSDARSLLVDRNGPALVATLTLANSLINQESGVRGYALTGRDEFLTPYRRGRAEALAARRQLRVLTDVPELETIARDLEDVEAAVSAWEREYAQRVIRSVQADGPGNESLPEAEEGRRLFDAVRVASGRQQADMLTLRDVSRDELASAANFLTGTFVAIAVLLVLGIVGVVVGLRAIVTRPLEIVSRRVRRTARGDFLDEIEGVGPADVRALARDVDTMRRQIVDELERLRVAHAQLDEQTRDLQRSNAELEQFAYVASHDLQEPLRKVASFCQLLEKRYGGQLDERGEQYIAFAVDGAKRMQNLINDLLAFSRVGRMASELRVVDGDLVLQQALTSLAAAVEESGAVIEADRLPRIRGEASLLAGVFQNLIGNALKFRGEEVPRIQVRVERDGDRWRFSVIDNGIGIEPDYAERIFMIFQRLHPKDVYAGTGIGLAMCRKIVEYHGGRIWLDTEARSGTTFRFTLPVLNANESETA